MRNVYRCIYADGFEKPYQRHNIYGVLDHCWTADQVAVVVSGTCQAGKFQWERFQIARITLRAKGV
jgi:hypothetical protein